jgi:Carboxypeptidase regulatory-like domain
MDSGVTRFKNDPARSQLLLRLVLAMTVAIALMVFGPSSEAQRTTGTLRGTVTDAQSAVIPDATVTARNGATGVEDKTVTTTAGTYAFPSVLPGTYTVTVEAKGFGNQIRKNVIVNANRVNDSNFTLSVQQATETVEVTASTEAIQTTTSTLSNTYESQQVTNLPNTAALNGNPLNLAIYAPNTTAQPGGVAGTGGAVGGTRPRDNNFMVDGVDDNNLGVTGPNSTVIPDSVAEFNLITNQFSAEYGHSAGGQFNLVTKSGTNQWHGSGEEYFQNRNLNALDNLTKAAIATGTPDHVPRFDANRFGGTLGGPIIKNKLFVFGAYEYTDIHGEGNASTQFVPTAAGLQQLQSLAANDTIRQRLGFLPVAPANDQGTVSVNGQDVPIGTLVLISPLLQREHDTTFNADYAAGAHHFGLRYLYNHELFILPVSVPQAEFNQDEPIRNHKVALTDTWTLNPHLVNDARLAYSRLGFAVTNHAGFDNVPSVSILELGLIGQGTADPQHYTQNTYQAIDNVSWSLGRHMLKFGGEYRHYIYPQFFLPRTFGDYWYNTTEDLVNDVVPTVPSRSLRGAGSGTFLGTQSAVYGFVQDDVKIRPRLTVNLGLRYEYWTNPVGSNTQTLNAVSDVPGVITFGKPKTDTNNFMPRVGFAWDVFGNSKTSLRGGYGIAYDVKFQNFASITLPPQLQSELNEASACTLTPQPGWCASGTGFLANGGLPAVFTPPTAQADARALTTSYIDDTVMPKVQTWSLSLQHELYKNAALELRYLGTKGSELPVQFRRNFRSAFDAGWQPLPTYFSPADVPANIANAPTHTREDFRAFATNSGAFANSGANTYAQYGFLGNVTADPALGSSIYHAGSVNFVQRARYGVTFNANYTWSHTIDNSTNEFNTSALNPRRAQDTLQIRQDRGNSDLDVRHKFALTVLYDVPSFAPKANALLNALANGFSINSTFLAQTGQPVTLQSGVDANANGDTAGDRVVLNPNGIGNTGSSVQTVCRDNASGNTFFSATTVNAGGGCGTGASGVGYVAVDPAARYLVAGPGALATVGRNSFYSPGFNVLNLSLFKQIRISESKYFQIRSEFYNVLNHRNYTIGNANISSTTSIPVAIGNANYVRAAAGPDSFLNPKLFSGGNRTVQLGAKFVF